MAVEKLKQMGYLLILQQDFLLHLKICVWEKASQTIFWRKIVSTTDFRIYWSVNVKGGYSVVKLLTSFSPLIMSLVRY